MDPVVSIIIPVYNGERYLAQALASVFAQTSSVTKEIIVVNDGSTDGTAHLLASYGNKIRVITQENKGVSAARNNGINHAQGSWFSFLDADDFWTPDHLERLLPATEQPETQAVCGKLRIFFEQSTTTSIMDPFHPLVPVWGALYRASVVKKIGPFDETMNLGEDYDWNNRFQEAGYTKIMIPQIIYLYRRHPDSATFSKETNIKAQIMATRKKIERLRHR